MYGHHPVENPSFWKLREKQSKTQKWILEREDGPERETQDSFKMKRTDEREREREALNIDFPFLFFFFFLSLLFFPSPFIVIEKDVAVCAYGTPSSLCLCDLPTVTAQQNRFLEIS